MPWIAAAILVVVIVIGAVAFLATRGGDDTPSGDPTGGTSQSVPATESSTPAPPVVPPFGTIDGATNTASTTGSLSIDDGFDKKVVSQAEFDGLKACGADSGLTQQLSASTWTGRGWVYSCRDAAAAERIANNLAGYFHAQDFKDIDLGTKTVFSTAKTAGGTTTVHSVYVSTTAVVFFETQSADQATALAQAKALFAAGGATYPSSYPVG